MPPPSVLCREWLTHNRKVERVLVKINSSLLGLLCSFVLSTTVRRTLLIPEPQLLVLTPSLQSPSILSHVPSPLPLTKAEAHVTDNGELEITT